MILGEKNMLISSKDLKITDNNSKIMVMIAMEIRITIIQLNNRSNNRIMVVNKNSVEDMNYDYLYF